MGIHTRFYLFQWKEMRKCCGMPGCLWYPAVYFQKKPWEYSLTLLLIQEKEALTGSGYEPQVDGSWDYTLHKYNCAWFAPVSPQRLWLWSSARDRTLNKTVFWHDLVHLLLLFKTLEKFQRDGCPLTGKKISKMFILKLDYYNCK